MNWRDKDAVPSPEEVADTLRGLAPQDTHGPEDFALRVLQRVGISPDRYDTYVRLDTPAGGLFVASSHQAVTGAALESGGLTAVAFEELHRSRTGRSALPAAKPFPGLTTAVRTGRAGRLPVDLSGLTAVERAVLDAVRTIPAGQLRPLSWIAREASLPDPSDPALLIRALAKNPVAVLIPCHRATYHDGTPCDVAYGSDVGAALRDADGIDMRRVVDLSNSGVVYLGSDTTHIYCHPTCAHARRITVAHQVPFRTARDARRAGYRACKSCRPVTA